MGRKHQAFIKALNKEMDCDVAKELELAVAKLKEGTRKFAAETKEKPKP